MYLENGDILFKSLYWCELRLELSCQLFRLDVLKRVRRHLPGETSKCYTTQLYTFLITDIAIAYSNFSFLNRLQNRGARIVLNLDCRSHVFDMLRVLKWLDIKQWHKLHMMKLLSNVSEVNSYNTRASLSGDLRVPNATLNTKKRTFQRRATRYGMIYQKA